MPHGEFYPDAHGDMDPGVFRIRGVKRAPKGR